jgi:hypothetical protein
MADVGNGADGGTGDVCPAGREKEKTMTQTNKKTNETQNETKALWQLHRGEGLPAETPPEAIDAARAVQVDLVPAAAPEDRVLLTGAMLRGVSVMAARKLGQELREVRANALRTVSPSARHALELYTHNRSLLDTATVTGLTPGMTANLLTEAADQVAERVELFLDGLRYVRPEARKERRLRARRNARQQREQDRLAWLDDVPDDDE